MAGQAFINACKTGKLSLAQSYYDSDKTVINCPDQSGWTGLDYSLYKNQHHVTQWLLTCPLLTLDRSNNYGWTALHYAAGFCQEREIVTNIASRMQSEWLNKKNTWGDTAVMLAVGWGTLQAVECLARVQGVLWSAGELKGVARKRLSGQKLKDMLDMLKKLEEERKGAAGQEEDKKRGKMGNLMGGLANVFGFHETKKKDNQTTSQLVVDKIEEEKEKKYQVDEKTFTALCKKGAAEEVKECLGAKPELLNCLSGEPLRMAALARKIRVVEVLMEYPGLLVNLTDKNGMAAVHIATTVNDPKLVQRLLNHPNIDVHLTNKKGWTPVELATKMGTIDSLKVLVEDDRVDLDVLDDNGKTLENLLGDDLKFQLPSHEIAKARKLFQEARAMRDVTRTRNKVALLEKWWPLE